MIIFLLYANTRKGDIMDYLFFILKTIIFFVLLIIIIRFLGKREVGELSVFDLVVLLMIADIATLGIQDDWKEVLLSIVALIVILVLQKVIAIISLHSPKFRKLIDCEPSIIIFKGKLNLQEMRKQSYTVDDLITQTREKGIMDLNTIQLAILEPSGELSVFTKADNQKIILPVVVSGEIVKMSLDFLKIKEDKIYQYLKKNNANIKDINYLTSDGNEFFLLPAIKVKEDK